MKGYRIALVWRREKERRELHSVEFYVDDVTPMVELMKLAVFGQSIEITFEDLDAVRALRGETDPCPRCKQGNSPLNSNCGWCGKAMKEGGTDGGLSEYD